MSSPFSRTVSLTAIILFFSFASLLAVMPPAPPEWYTERMNVPIPENYSRAIPEKAAKLHEDLPDRVLNKRMADTDNLLLILVEFPDNLANQVTHPQSAYDDMMFSTGVVPTGSLVEYYEEVSYGTFTPAGTVTVWIMAPHPYTYYANAANGMGGYPNNSQGLLEDCVQQLDILMDFSDFDNDNDGYADGIFLVHAGPGAEETGDPNDIWSHAWYHEYMTDDGVSTGRYSTEPEEHMDGSMIAIGVFCHEYGHVLGMPDLYDTDGSSEGIGVYCLMSAGSWGALPGNPERPTHMSAEMKRRLGWLTPIEVTSNLTGEMIPPVATNAVCYQVTNPLDPNEYYLIENRAKIGFDSLFRGDGGLAIWHVDWSGRQRNEEHRYVSLEQCDGNGDLERDYGTGNRHERTNRGDAGDLYSNLLSNDYFSFSSHPNSYAYDGSDAFMTLDNISQIGNDISVDIHTYPTDYILRFESLTVNDDAAPSNHNNEADSGETVELHISLAVDGADFGTLLGVLVTSDTRVSLTDANSSFVSSDHNTYTNNFLDPFTIEVLDPGSDSAVFFILTMLVDGEAYELEFNLNINRQPVLLVLDNNGSHWSDNIIEALYNVGTYSFDVWNTDESGTPTYNDLIPYNAVLWTTASYFGNRTSSPNYEYCLSPTELDALTSYLDAEGRVGLFSQDYLYDLGLNSFASNYLKVQSYTEDQPVNTITGTAGYYGGSGDASQWSMYDYTDFIVPVAGAGSSVEQDGTANNVGIHYPAAGPNKDSYATTFTSIAIERLDAPSLEGLLSDWMDWMMTDPGIDVPLPILPAEGDTLTTAPLEFSWIPVEGAVSYSAVIATDQNLSGGSIIGEIQTTEPFGVYTDVLAEGDYYWAVSALGVTDTSAHSPIESFSFYMDYICGDANADGTASIGDAVYIVNYVFKDGPPPIPEASGDVNCDGSTNIGDAVYLIVFIFQSGAAPCDCE